MCIGYHTGIKIGAYFGYNGTRFYNNSDWATQIFSVGDGDNNVRVYGDIRSPIYYDSDNTGYYTNPAGASVFSDIRGNAGNLQIVANNVGRNTKWRQLESSTDIGISFYNAADTWLMQLYANAGTEYGFLNGNWASWDLRKIPSGNLHMNNNNSYYLNAPSDNFLYRVYGAADIRSPIFYDYNNTSYYADLNGTTYCYYLQSATSVRADSDRRIKDNIQKIENALDKVIRLQGVSFTRKDLEDKKKKYIGLIAQDVLEVIPEVVSGSEESRYSVGYSELVAVLIEAVKEQNTYIKEQDARIIALENKLN